MVQIGKTFSDITQEMLELYIKKNKDYGDSFNKTIDDFGVVAALVRMNDKMNRLKSIYNKEVEIKDESMRDTLLDLGSYAIMTLMYLDSKNGKMDS